MQQLKHTETHRSTTTSPKHKHDESSFILRQINKCSVKTLQKAVFLFFLIPQVLVINFCGFTAQRDFFNSFLKSFSRHQEIPHLKYLILALVFERLVYTFVWLAPQQFQNLFKTQNPVDTVVSLFYTSKVLQFGGLLMWYVYTAPPANMLEITPFQWVTGTQLILFGQLLNYSVFAAIGKNGVFYGNKFGKSIPWCTGFPFSVFTAHPQYYGAVSTMFGVIVLLTTEAHANAGIFALGVFQAILYFYMALVESL